MSLNTDFFKKEFWDALPLFTLCLGTALALYLAFFYSQPRLQTVEVATFKFERPERLPLQLSPVKRAHKFYTRVKDPFYLPDLQSDTEERLPQLRLSMIIINKRHKMCRVNGRLYREGESGPDFLVKFIGEQGVLVERKGKGQWLFLTQSS